MWFEDPKVWFAIAGVVMQAGISYAAVAELKKARDDHEERIRELERWQHKASGKLGINGGD